VLSVTKPACVSISQYRFRSKKGYSTTNEDKMHKRRHNDLYSDTESEVDAIGASVRGIERYNDIIKHVYKMRQKQEQKDMENTIMREYSTLDESKKRKRKCDESDLESEIEVDAFDAYNFDPTAL